MRMTHAPFSFACMLIMALGTTHGASAGTVEAPAKATVGHLDSGDMVLRSVGVCRSEYDPRSNKRVYACEFKTSDACVRVGARDMPLSMAAGGSQRRYICPAPNS